MNTVFITGASSGIGKASATYFSEKGWQVVATVREKDQTRETLGFNERVLVVPGVDITKPQTVKKAVNAGIKEFSGIDALINNAGFGLIGAVETCSDEQIRAQFEVNTFGHITVLKALLPHFREQNSGCILNITSIGGRITFPFFGYYNASKYAMEAVSEALWYELSETGIRVKVFEPGFTRTGFATKGMQLGSRNLSFYNKAIKKLKERLESGTQQGGGSDPADIAEEIFKAVNDDSRQLRYHSGSLSGPLLFARKYFPDTMFMNLIKRRV